MNMNQILKQAQAMQKDMMKAQEEVGKMTFNATKDLVTVEVNGNRKVTKVTLSKDIDVDDEIDSTSTNPVQNQVIAAALDDKQDTLIAGSGIEIDEDNVIKTTGATIYANALYPSGE